MIKEWEESRIQTKEEIQKEQEKEAWENLMYAINNMGSITTEKFNYKQYHRDWDILVDKVRIYKRVAKLDEKYGLDKEV